MNSSRIAPQTKNDSRHPQASSRWPPCTSKPDAIIHAIISMNTPNRRGASTLQRPSTIAPRSGATSTGHMNIENPRSHHTGSKQKSA